MSAGLSRLAGERWQHFGVDDGLPVDYVSDVFFGSTGEHFVLTRAGLAVGADDRFRQPLVEAGLAEVADYYWSIVERPSGELVAASSRHFFERVDGRWERLDVDQRGVRYPALLRTKDGEILSLPQTLETAFVRLDPTGFVDVTERFPWTGDSVQQLAEAPDGAVWVVGGHVILRWDRAGLRGSVFEGVPQPMLVDGQGGLWFADGQRVLRRLGDEWTELSGACGRAVPDGQGGAWTATERTFVHWRSPGSVWHSVPLPGDLSIHSFAGVDAAGTPWAVGQDDDRFYALGLDGAEWRTTPIGPATLRVPRVACDPVERGLWVLAEEPVEPRPLRRVALAPADALELSLPAAILLAENIRVTRTTDGSVWLHGYFGLYRLPALDGSWELVHAVPRQHVQSLQEHAGSLWVVRVSTVGGRSGLSLLHDGRWSHRDLEVRRWVGWAPDGGPIFARGDRLYRMRPGRLDQEQVIDTHLRGLIEAVVVDGEGNLVGCGQR